MPIGEIGTDEYTHFSTLYSEWIKPTLEEVGYSTLRSDEIQETGAITKDIVLALAKSDLVVADLTHLKPNVFYELGARHALRGQGTVMLIDDTKTTNTPFDVAAYRMIRYSGDLIGIGRLRSQLQAFAENIISAELLQRDNPIHDWIPSLPVNAMTSLQSSQEGRLREEAATLRQLIDDYQSRFGSLEPTSERRTRPIDVVATALQAARQGLTVPALLSAALSAADQRDIVAYLEVVNKILTSPTMRPKSNDFLALASAAASLDLDDVRKALFDHSLQLYPKDDNLRRAQLGFYAHSSVEDDRAFARRESASFIGMEFTDGGKAVPPSDFDQDVGMRGTWATMLDAYYQDHLIEELVGITQAFIEQYPTTSCVVRNYARALAGRGATDESLEYYRRAVLCPDVDGTSATWYGSELHNRRRRVDAIEAYALAAILDADNPKTFSRLADELADTLRDAQLSFGKGDGRSLPAEIGVPTVERAITAALSCSTLSQEALRECQEAARTAELYNFDTDSVVAALRSDDTGRLRLTDRADFAHSLYSTLRSNVTSDIISEEQTR
jgi:tetratricopeptide (TPR) repeat protein